MESINHEKLPPHDRYVMKARHITQERVNVREINVDCLILQEVEFFGFKHTHVAVHMLSRVGFKVVSTNIWLGAWFSIFRRELFVTLQRAPRNTSRLEAGLSSNKTP
jgi:hypothetical protein